MNSCQSIEFHKWKRRKCQGSPACFLPALLKKLQASLESLANHGRLLLRDRCDQDHTYQGGALLGRKPKAPVWERRPSQCMQQQVFVGGAGGGVAVFALKLLGLLSRATLSPHVDPVLVLPQSHEVYPECECPGLASDTRSINVSIDRDIALAFLFGVCFWPLVELLAFLRQQWIGYFSATSRRVLRNNSP